MSQKQEWDDLKSFEKIKTLIPTEFQINEIKKWKIYKNKGLRKYHFLKSNQRYPLNQTYKFDELSDLIEKITYGQSLEQNQRFEQFKESIKPKIEKGFILENISRLQRIVQNNVVNEQLEPKIEIITIIIFWNSEYNKSTQILQQINELLENNQNLKLQLESFAISLDDNIDNLQDYLQLNKINNFQHYHYKFGWDTNDQLQRALQLNHLPKIVILGKQNEVIGITRKSKDIEDIIKNYLEIESEKENENEEKYIEILDRDIFRFIKLALIQQIVHLFENMKLAKSDFIKLSFTKINKINNDGNKEILQRGKIKISYEVSIQNQQIIKQFINTVKNIVGQDNVLIKRSIIKDPQGMVEMIQYGFEQILKKYGKVIQDIKIRDEIFSYDHISKQFIINVNINQWQVLNDLTYEEYKQIYQEMFPLFVKYQQEVEESDDDPDNDEEQEDDRLLIVNHINKLKQILKYGLQIQIGQQFQNIQDYFTYNNEQQLIEHQENQILIIIYWDNNQKCNKYFFKLMKYIIQNESKFQNILKIKALSIYPKNKQTQFFQQNKGIENIIDFYFPNEENQIDLIQYNVQQELPYIVIVDKYNTVRQCQYIDDIESVLQQYFDEKQEDIQKMGPLNDDEYTLLTQFINSENVNKLEIFNNKLQFQLQFKNKEIDYGQKIINFTPIIEYTIRDNKIKYLDQYLNQLNNIIQLNTFQINKTIQKTINFIFPGKECKLCQQELNDQIQQYYCPFNNEFYCCKCSETINEKSFGYNKFRVKDNLVFFNAPIIDKSILNDIDEYRLGTNLKIKLGEQFNQDHQMDCNGCDNTIIGFRYIALNCLPGKLTDLCLVDFCQECFQQIKNKGSKLSFIIKKNKIYKYNPQMLLLRIPFYQGYYEY